METTYKYLKQEWKELWNQKIDDRWRSEAIARREYAVLFVDQGDVVWATRDFRPLQFYDILDHHEKTSGERLRPIDPNIGGWGKFIKNEVSKQKPRKALVVKELRDESKNQHYQHLAKKNGRGWQHAH